MPSESSSAPFEGAPPDPSGDGAGPRAPSGGTGAEAGVSASAGNGRGSRRGSVVRSRPWVAACFLLPALLLLGALVAYPVVYSVYRSLFDASGSGFVGLDNYVEIFTDDGILTAVQNNLIWVVVAPSLATALGLIFAVLTERVRWGTAFKLIVFMPMAISMLAAGIIFRLVYEQDPDRGVANAVWTGVHDTFAETSPWPGAHPRADAELKPTGDGDFTTDFTASSSDPAALPLVGVVPKEVEGAERAAPADPERAGEKSPERAEEKGAVTGTVWLDFVRGGKSEQGVVDSGERGLAGIEVLAVKDGRTVAKATTAADGTFSLDPAAEGAQLRLPAANFAEPYNGVDWLGPSLVTPAIIGSYVWMWAGFAMVLIAAGLAGVPRELTEAARVDGATEWQVFRKVTVPLLAPVLGVVMVTLMINVLKVFDLVYIIAPSATQSDANVLALELYLSSFGTSANQGLGSAIAVILFVLVVPVMVVNIRRLRRESRR